MFYGKRRKVDGEAKPVAALKFLLTSSNDLLELA